MDFSELLEFQTSMSHETRQSTETAFEKAESGDLTTIMQELALARKRLGLALEKEALVLKERSHVIEEAQTRRGESMPHLLPRFLDLRPSFDWCSYMYLETFLMEMEVTWKVLMADLSNWEREMLRVEEMGQKNDLMRWDDEQISWYPIWRRPRSDPWWRPRRFVKSKAKEAVFGWFLEEVQVVSVLQQSFRARRLVETEKRRTAVLEKAWKKAWKIEQSTRELGENSICLLCVSSKHPRSVRRLDLWIELKRSLKALADQLKGKCRNSAAPFLYSLIKQLDPVIENTQKGEQMEQEMAQRLKELYISFKEVMVSLCGERSSCHWQFREGSFDFFIVGPFLIPIQEILLFMN
jgi:hypothetical protein